LTRVESILEDTFYTECMAKIDAREEDRKFCRHNFQHFVDVARITYILMLESGAIKKFMEENNLNLKLAKELIYAAALLHDIGRWKQYDTGEDHADVSAGLAVEMLANTGFNDSEINVITTGIREHRRMTDNMSLLGEHLYMADNLSRICSRCATRDECYKFDEMETGRRMLIY